MTLPNLRREILLNCLLALLAFFTLFPLVLMFSISLKTMGQFAVHPLSITMPLHFENYVGAIKVLWRPTLNTSLVACLSIVGALATSSLAAYAFARHSFPGDHLLFYMVLALLMIPGLLLLVPRYVITANLNLTESYWGLIIPYISSAQVFNMFVLKTFFASLPQELVDAARIDGAGEARIFGSIVLPLSKPIMGTLAILQLVGIWNDFIWPFVIITESQMRTITVQLRFLQGMFGSEWGLIMAGYAVASVPLIVIFALFTKPFIEGMTSGAIKL
jgi:ABC-type glycerol-3-phosphate transport system permease component